MDTIGLTGAIGTWVAVFITIVALIGIAGPLLVLRARRTDRHVALRAVDSGLAEDGAFLTTGIRFWPGKPGIFRRVKAPLLRSRPNINAAKFVFDKNFQQVSKASCSWVKFWLILRAYDVYYAVGDSLEIRDRQALLPVSKIWILVLGLVALEDEKDMGKIPKRIRRGIKSKQAIPGSSVSRSPDPRRGNEDNVPGWMTSRPRWAESAYDDDDEVHIHGHNHKRFHGIIGALCARSSYSSGSDCVHLDTHELDEIGDIGSEKLRLDQLFWLAVGCITFMDGRVFSLENVQSIAIEDEEDEEPEQEDEDEDGHSSNYRNSYAQAPKSPTVVHWEDDTAYRPRYHQSRQYSWDHQHVSPTSYIPVVAETPRSALKYTTGVRGFKFSPTEQRNESFYEIVQALKVEQPSTVVMSLEEIALSAEERAQLDNFANATYPPCDSEWVRLSEADKSRSTASSSWFLKRSDAQVLAQGLLTLPICQKGYLFGAAQSSLCRTFLCSAAPNIPHLLTYLIFYFDHLQIPPESKQSLQDAMKALLKHMQKFEYSRSFMTAIHETDEALRRVLPPNEKVVVGIGVLTFSNQEFRDLINLSVRRLPQSIQQSVQIDLTNPALVVKAVFGAEQRFPIDLAALFPEHSTSTATDTMSGPNAVGVSFTHLVLIVLKASLRSAFLKTSLNSLPLFEQFAKMDEVVYVH